MIGPVVSLPCRLASSANRQHPPPLTTSTSFSTSTKPAIARSGLLTAIILHTPARLVSAGWLATAGCCCCPSFRFVSLATYSLSDTNSRYSPSASERACVSCTIPSCTVCLCVRGPRSTRARSHLRHSPLPPPNPFPPAYLVFAFARPAETPVSQKLDCHHHHHHTPSDSKTHQSTPSPPPLISTRSTFILPIRFTTLLRAHRRASGFLAPICEC